MFGFIKRMLKLRRPPITINDMVWARPISESDPTTVAISLFLTANGVENQLRWQFRPECDDNGNLDLADWPECIGIYKAGIYRMTLITIGYCSLSSKDDILLNSYELNDPNSLSLILADTRKYLDSV